MGGRRDPKVRFRLSMPRVSRTTTLEPATATPPISQNIVSTFIDEATIDAAQIVHPTPHNLTTMTVEDTFKSIVLSTATTTAALPNDQGVRTRGMKKRSLTPMKKIPSNEKHNPTTPHLNATRKRTPAQMTDDNDIEPPDPATPSHKKQKMSPTDATASKDSPLNSVGTPDTMDTTATRDSTMTTDTAATKNSNMNSVDTSVTMDTTATKDSTMNSVDTMDTMDTTASGHSIMDTVDSLDTIDTTAFKDSTMDTVDTPNTKISTVATTSPAETLALNTCNCQKTKASSKAAARTKSEIQRKRAIDRARRAETRAEKAEALLTVAHDRSPERLKLGVLAHFSEERRIQNEQIKDLSQQAEEREVEIAQQKGRIRSHMDWEKTYKANLAEFKEDLKSEKALVMEYLKIIVQRDGSIYEQNQTIQKLQEELDGLRTIVTQKDEVIEKIQAEQKSVKGALESIREQLGVLK